MGQQLQQQGHFDIAIGDSALLVIDMQEAFCASIPDIVPPTASVDGADDADSAHQATPRNTGSRCKMLIQGVSALDMPIIFSEQYPERLGATLATLRHAAQPASAAVAVYPKTHFSCLDDPTLRTALATSERQTIILCGIEAHICVLSTACDLRQRGYNVIVACDAIASRAPENCDYARTALSHAGCICVPVESILFRLQRQSGSDVGAFKTLSALVR